MARLGGRQNEVGIGIESLAAPGVAVAEAHSLQWNEITIQGHSEKEFFKSARGLRIENSDSFIRRKFGRGTVKFVPTHVNMPFMLSLLLGSVSTGANADGSGNVYDHTFTVQNSNASPRTATLTVKNGSIVVSQLLNAVMDKLSISVKDGYAEATAEFIGKYPISDTFTASYTADDKATYNNTTVKFGTSLSNASGNSATPLKSFDLEVQNSYLFDDAFLFGSNDIITGGLTMGPLSVSGAYSLPFADTTELNKYLANTKNAALFSMQGTTTIGTGELGEVLIKLGKLVLNKEPLTHPINGISMVEQEFEVEYDSTDKEIQAVVTNLVSNAAGSPYSPA